MAMTAIQTEHTPARRRAVSPRPGQLTCGVSVLRNATSKTRITIPRRRADDRTIFVVTATATGITDPLSQFRQPRLVAPLIAAARVPRIAAALP